MSRRMVDEREQVVELIVDVLSSERAMRALLARVLLQAYEDACALARGQLPPGEAVVAAGLSKDERKAAHREKVRSALEDLKAFLRGSWCEEMCEAANLDADLYRAKLGLTLAVAEARAQKHA
ncbi:MAG: hypothetical protein ACUVS5_13020 [Anaerolineae bacterium]